MKLLTIICLILLTMTTAFGQDKKKIDDQKKTDEELRQRLKIASKMIGGALGIKNHELQLVI